MYRVIEVLQEYIDRTTGQRSIMAELVADTAADLPTNTQDLVFVIGSYAETIDTGDKYKINSSGVWVLQPSENQFENTYTQEQIDNLLSDKVGKTEYATQNQYGIARIMSGGGLRVDGEEPLLCVDRANEGDITAETQQFKPIVPYTIPYMMGGYGISSKTIIPDHNAELARLIDSGAKNLLTVSSGGNTTTQRFVDVPCTAKAGTYVLYFGHLESTDTDSETCAISFKDANAVDVGASSVYQFSRGDGVYNVITLKNDNLAQIRIYSANNFATSAGDVVIFTDAMFCTKSAWDISQAYVPYCPTLQDLYNLVKSYHP